MVMAPDGTVITTNPVWTSVLCWPEQAQVGGNWAQVIDPQDALRVATAIDQLQRGSRLPHRTLRCAACGRGGGVVAVEWSGVAGGGSIGLIGLIGLIGRVRQSV